VLKDKKAMPAPGWLLFAFIAYIVWVNITQITSIAGEKGLFYYDRAWKVLLFTFLLSFMARTRARIEAFIWVICLSIGNFAVSGAVKTILSGGGGFTVVGSGANMLADRVAFAIAITTIIPFARFLRNHATLVTQSRSVRIGLDLFSISCVLSTIGTQARTGLISLGVLGAFYFLKAKNKLATVLVGVLLVGMVFAVAPGEWFERMHSITNYQSDGSAMGRIDSWIWGWDFTKAHPIVGGGFHSYVLHHFPTPDSPEFLEAHNILFETMADHGFVGLALFLILMLGTYMNCGTMRRRARLLPELEWAANLGTMLQLALLTFLAGSMFLSDATISMPYEMVALSLAARGVVERRLAREPKAAFVPLFADGRRAAPPAPAPAMAYVRQP
jgi:probable O-glycosylation ligase (exosortase A-associated)